MWREAGTEKIIWMETQEVKRVNSILQYGTTPAILNLKD